MFEKHRNGKQEPLSETAAEPQPGKAAPASQPASNARVAYIGPGIHINGDISGEENLLIEGKVDGKVRVEAHQVEIGRSGLVKADISAKVIKIAGKVRGDIKGTEKVVISSSGNVQGNIVAPRMTLEDGAIFKGSIDMDPGDAAKSTAGAPAVKATDKVAEKPADPAQIAKSEKGKQSSSYSLNGS